MAGLVLNSTAVLRLNFCAKLNIYTSISATSPSCKPDSLGLVGDDLDIISFVDGFKKENPDFDMVKYRKEKSEIENRRRAFEE